jgi:hypothetical protein
VSEPAREPTPERVWSDDEIKQALELFEQGTSIRRLSSALGISRHQAEKFLSAARAAQAESKPKPDPWPAGAFKVAREPGDPRVDPYCYAASPPTPAPLPMQDFETLQRTRQELKSRLDQAAQLGDRAGVATFSLAIARLNSTSDPGEADRVEAGYDFSGASEAVLNVLRIVIRGVRSLATDGNEEKPTLTPEQDMEWKLYAAAIEATAARLATPIKSGATIAIKFTAP